MLMHVKRVVHYAVYCDSIILHGYMLFCVGELLGIRPKRRVAANFMACIFTKYQPMVLYRTALSVGNHAMLKSVM